VQVEALIKDLLATGSMNEDTTADLNRWLDEAGKGTLHPDDAAYVAALHAKIIGAPVEEAAESASTEPVRLDGLTLEDWRDRALRAEAELAQLKDSVSSTSA
jgi:hypothetical protein